MRIGFDLHLEQTQKLIMTPELRQAITILQLSALELTHYVEQQLQENPLLELAEEDEEPAMVEISATGEEQLPAEERERFDLNWEDYFSDSSDLGLPYRGEKEYVEEERESFIDRCLSKAPSLTEHLLFQLHLVGLPPMEYKIGEFLIGNIDEHGYLQISVDEVAKILKISTDVVEKVLKVIQSFDPPGVGARTLAECLLIQVEQRQLTNPLLRPLITDYLYDLARGKLARLAQQLGVSVHEIQVAADIIRTLDPKPGRNFASGEETRYILPDVIVEKVGDDYVVLVNDAVVPRLTVSNYYRRALREEGNFDPKTRRYVESKLNSALWLLRSIEQRRLTLYRVARCLVDMQRDFFEKGIKYLKPLNLKKVAEALGLHESTVSRATSNKYMQTPQGLFEMKFFFSSGLVNDAGTMVSAESIKRTLQEIIAGEDPRHPYNDQQLADIFQARGIHISRRTIAKYRDELGIPPIRKRKRY